MDLRAVIGRAGYRHRGHMPISRTIMATIALIASGRFLSTGFITRLVVALIPHNIRVDRLWRHSTATVVLR